MSPRPGRDNTPALPVRRPVHRSGEVPDFSMSSQSGHILLPNRKASQGVIMFSLNESPKDKTAGHVYAGLARLFRLLRNARGAGRSRSLGPIEIEGSSLAPTENSTMPPNNTHGTQSLGEVEHCAMKHCDFRRIALSMPETEELNGMGYHNFRTGRKSFATIEDTMAIIRLTRDQQANFVALAPEVFAPDSSGWGRLGSTVIRLEAADEATVQVAIATAWRNVAEVGKASEVAHAVDVESASEFVNLAEAGDAGEVANESGSAALAKVADVVEIEHVVVNGEPGDPWLSVFERLQMCLR
jgi:hypothetical protein